MVILGFDPGQTGAIAAYDGTIITGLIDMPTMSRLHGSGRQVDPYTLATEILDLCAGRNPRR